MSDRPRPVKVAPSSSKKGRPSINCQRCVIYQVFSSEQLSSSTSKCRFTLISAIAKRKVEGYRRLVDEFNTIENVHTETNSIS